MQQGFTKRKQSLLMTKKKPAKDEQLHSFWGKPHTLCCKMGGGTEHKNTGCSTAARAQHGPSCAERTLPALSVGHLADGWWGANLGQILPGGTCTIAPPALLPSDSSALAEKSYTNTISINKALVLTSCPSLAPSQAEWGLLLFVFSRLCHWH